MSFICCCARKTEKFTERFESPTVTFRSTSTVQYLQTPDKTAADCRASFTSQTVIRLRGELGHMRQNESQNNETQHQTTEQSLKQHKTNMADMKSKHDVEMTLMCQANTDGDAACDKRMTEMCSDSQRRLDQATESHQAGMSAQHRTQDAVKARQNEALNVQKMQNQNRATNVRQNYKTKFAESRQQREHDAGIHWHRMEVLSLSNQGAVKEAETRNGDTLQAKRRSNRNSVLAHQNRVHAANVEHHRSLDNQQARHGKKMGNMKQRSDDQTATHCTKMGRMQNKNKHKSYDADHMVLRCVSLEARYKATQVRCDNQKKILAEHQVLREQTHGRRALLTEQAETLRCIEASIDKDRVECAQQAASIKRSKFEDDKQEVLFCERQIEAARLSSIGFREDMSRLLDVLGGLNGRMGDAQR